MVMQWPPDPPPGVEIINVLGRVFVRRSIGETTLHLHRTADYAGNYPAWKAFEAHGYKPGMYSWVLVAGFDTLDEAWEFFMNDAVALLPLDGEPRWARGGYSMSNEVTEDTMLGVMPGGEMRYVGNDVSIFLDPPDKTQQWSVEIWWYAKSRRYFFCAEAEAREFYENNAIVLLPRSDTSE